MGFSGDSVLDLDSTGLGVGLFVFKTGLFLEMGAGSGLTLTVTGTGPAGLTGGGERGAGSERDKSCSEVSISPSGTNLAISSVAEATFSAVIGEDSVSAGAEALGFDNTGRFNVGFTGAFEETSDLGGVATKVDSEELASS